MSDDTKCPNCGAGVQVVYACGRVMYYCGSRSACVEYRDQCYSGPFVESNACLRNQLADAKAECERMRAIVNADNAAFDALTDAPEINPSNYDHDDVCRLNREVCYAHGIMKAARAAAQQPEGGE